MYSTAFMGLMGGGGLNNLFSVTPYTGNGSTQSIVTGQNLAAGGLAWTKTTNVVSDHPILDTVRGTSALLRANQAVAENTSAVRITSFNSNGITLNSDGEFNSTGSNQILFSWLEQAGYMDIVTYTGDGTTPRNLAHNLGALVKMAIIKQRNSSGSWVVGHESATWTKWGALQSTAAFGNATSEWNNTAPTSSVITLGNSSDVNGNGSTYVAYLFAEKAGKSKFGAQSGTTTINTGLPSIKAVLKKRTDSTGDWYLFYNDGGTWYHVKPNTTGARATGLITVSGGDITFSGAASTGNGIYAAWG